MKPARSRTTTTYLRNPPPPRPTRQYGHHQYGLGADAADPAAPLVWSYGLGVAPDGSPYLSLLTTLGRVQRDVRLDYETSVDLISWQTEVPIKEVLGATELLEQVNLRFPLQSRER